MMKTLALFVHFALDGMGSVRGLSKGTLQEPSLGTFPNASNRYHQHPLQPTDEHRAQHKNNQQSSATCQDPVPKHQSLSHLTTNLQTEPITTSQISLSFSYQ